MVDKNILYDDLHTTIESLGKDGGCISPSIYDTAQLLRFWPPKEGPVPAIEWLLQQQKADGGWGDPHMPLFRDSPTLASLLALSQYQHIIDCSEHIQSGFNYLQKTANKWLEANRDEWPPGVELIFPNLLEALNPSENILSLKPYQYLIEEHDKSISKIKKYAMQMKKTVAVYHWESWGESPDLDLQDPLGGIASNCASTARWLNLRQKFFPEDSQPIEMGKDFLEKAHKITGVGIPGVVPTFYPMDRFEEAFGLYPLTFNCDILNFFNKQFVFKKSLQVLAAGIKSHGVGYNDYFIPDSDDTAVALYVLKAGGVNPDPKLLDQYKIDNYFESFLGQKRTSISVNIHAVHALQYLQADTHDTLDYLIKLQQADGRWMKDEWHVSWLYITSHMLLILANTKHTNTIHKALNALLANQCENGGWGFIKDAPTIEETSYVVSALQVLKNKFLNEAGERALQRGFNFLLRAYPTYHQEQRSLWIGKELYLPYRIDRMFYLVPLLSGILDATPATC